MKKKIIFVAPNLHHGGAESVLVKIVNNIDLEVFDVKLVLIKMEGDHLSKINRKIDVVDLKSKKSYYSIIKLIQFLRTERPDYVFSIIGHVNVLMAILKTLFFKNLFFIGRENVVYSEWLYKDKNLKKIILNILYKIFLKKLDIVVVQSDFMSNEVQKYFNVEPEKIKKIKNPIEDKIIKKLSTETSLENWNYNKKNLIAIGRIESVKNYFEMIKIIEKLPKDYHLNIFGDGSESLKLKTHVKKMDLNHKVTFHGFTSNPYKYIKVSELLILTSFRESSPNVVVEANACGIYAISYRMPGGIDELIKQDVNGSLIPFGDKESFIKEILENPKNEKKSMELISYSQKYSIEKFMAEFYALLN